MKTTRDMDFTNLSAKIVTSCQVLEPEETVPHASTTTARILMNHLTRTLTNYHASFQTDPTWQIDERTSVRGGGGKVK